MAYDNGFLLRHTFPLYDYGADANEAYSFRGPTGKKGIIRKTGVMVTETFACDVTAAKFELGITGNADEYAALNIADGAADLDCFDETDDPDAIIQPNIPADQVVLVTHTQGADTTGDTGQGIPFCDIYWYD